MTSIFGAIRVASDVENNVLLTLEDWFPTYLKEFELQAGLIPNPAAADVIPLPKSWLTSATLDREAQGSPLPTIIVVSPGLSKRQFPKMEGDGTFRTWWQVGIGVMASADTRQHTNQLIRFYCAIIRTICLQQQGFNGFADGSTWIDESFDDIFRFADDETISAGEVVFEVEVAEVVSRRGGPAKYGGPQPGPDPTQPGSSWPLVNKTTATVTRKV